MSKRGEITGYLLRDNTSKKQPKDGLNMTESGDLQNSMEPAHVTPANNVAAGNSNNKESNEPVSMVSTGELKSLILRMEQGLTTRFDRMEKELKSMKEDQKVNREKIDGLEHIVMNTKSKVDVMEDSVIPSIKGDMDHNLALLNDKLTLMEIHNRKPNLLFYGVEQKEDENLKDVMRKCWEEDFGVPEELNIAVVHAHRLPRQGQSHGPDPIIVKFVHMEDRDWFLDFAKKRPFNKDKKPVSVYTDLPRDLKRTRAKAAQVAKEMRKDGKQARIRLAGTKIILECRDKVQKGAKPGAWVKGQF
jgi:hypothetical protein